MTSGSLTIGTRGSPLAITQTESVVVLLRARLPELEVRVQRGDPPQVRGAQSRCQPPGILQVGSDPFQRAGQQGD